MKKIVICICTRRRPEGVTRLLKSIFKQNLLNLNLDIGIVVVENDIKPYSKKLVFELALESPFPLSYFWEMRQGLSFARNRTVKEAGDCDFCCFVDDDQEVAPDWILELIKCQSEFNADGVWGPNPPIFEQKVHPSIVQFHISKFNDYGTIVKRAFTNCLLLKKDYLDRFDGPFDLRLNFTGGEDRYLTYLISINGGIIRCNPNAKAYEIIPKSRTTINYVFRRMYKMSNTRFFVNSLEEPELSNWSLLPRLLLRFSYGALIFFPLICFGKANRLNGLTRIADALGGFAYIFGKKNNFYR